MRICPSCGIIAAASLSACQGCGEPYPERLPEASLPDGETQWVCLQSSFVCGNCRFQIPLTFLDLDGSVRCNNCGVDQGFPLQDWQEVLHLAHGIIDFTGPQRPPEDSPLWRFFYDALPDNAMRETVHLGRHVSLIHLESTKTAAMVSLALSTGTPLCEQCRAPLSARVDQEGALCLTCTACGHTQRYLRDATFDAIEGLDFALANEHREGTMGAIVSASSTAEVVALECPKCGGSLPPYTEHYHALCTYCGTPCYVNPALLSVSHLPETPPPLWLLFRGSSAFKYEIGLKAFELEKATNRNRPRTKVDGSSSVTTPSRMAFLTSHPLLLSCGILALTALIIILLRTIR